MNNSIKISGFTFIELIVVILIISMILVFSFPMFRQISLFSNSQGQAGDIARLADDLKSRAVSKNTDFMLHIDPSARLVWVTHELMDADQRTLARDKGSVLSDGTHIDQVQVAANPDADSAQYQIRFSKKGYSDFAFIFLNENDREITIQIEPFLANSQIVNGHILLEACK